MAVVLLEAS